MKTINETFLDPPVQSHDDADRELVRRFQAGDESAFDEIVATHQQRLAHLLYRLLGWSHDGEDLLQNVFVAALSKLRGFRGDSKLSTWLTTIAIRQYRSHQRRQWLRQRLRPRVVERQLQIQKVGDETPDEHEAIRNAVRTLPAKLREPLVLRYFEAMPVPEIAASLGLSVGAVEVRLTRARQRLKEMLLRWETHDDLR
jgi:RNA polymerase sigma factor (sigma-70 family)